MNDTDGTLILELVHHHTPLTDVRLRLRDVSGTLRNALLADECTWGEFRRVTAAWTLWRSYTLTMRRRVRSRILRPVVISWNRHRVRTDETPILQ